MNAELNEFISSIRPDSKAFDEEYEYASFDLSKINPAFGKVEFAIPASLTHHLKTITTAFFVSYETGLRLGRPVAGFAVDQSPHNVVAFAENIDPEEHTCTMSRHHYEDTETGLRECKAVLTINAVSTQDDVFHEACHWAEDAFFNSKQQITDLTARGFDVDEFEDTARETGQHPFCQERFDFDSWHAWYTCYTEQPGERFVTDCYVTVGYTLDQAKMMSHGLITNYINDLRKVATRDNLGRIRPLYKERDLAQRARQLLYSRIEPKDIPQIREEIKFLCEIRV